MSNARIRVVNVKKSQLNVPDKKDLPMMLDLNSEFTWKRNVDVLATFKKAGWTPPSEYRDDYYFLANRVERGE